MNLATVQRALRSGIQRVDEDGADHSRSAAQKSEAGPEVEQKPGAEGSAHNGHALRVGLEDVVGVEHDHADQQTARRVEQGQRPDQRVEAAQKTVCK